MHSLHHLAHKTLPDSSLKSIQVALYDAIPAATSLAHTLHELEPDKQALKTRPWRSQPQYFTQVLISTLAMVKMASHAKLGGSIEVMGMMTGKIVRNLFVVMDVYLLPVEGTETRVNAQSDAYEYMVQYLDLLKSVGIDDTIVGWYHSHPGYGCWLSGIDVATQSLNQNFQDPYLAIVVDPIQSANQGKIEIGAFRTFPVGHVSSVTGDASTAGARKKRDLGAHSALYYSLDIKLFKSPRDEGLVDQILNKSWMSNLAASINFQQDYERRLIAKIEELDAGVSATAQLKDFRVNSRFNAMFESMVLHKSPERRSCNPGPTFAGLVSTSIEEDDEMEQDDDMENPEEDDEPDDEDEYDAEEERKGVPFPELQEEMDHRSVSNIESSSNMGSSLAIVDLGKIASPVEENDTDNLVASNGSDNAESSGQDTSNAHPGPGKRTVLMRKGLGPIQFDSRDNSIDDLGSSSFRDRKRAAGESSPMPQSNDLRSRMQSLLYDMKQRNKAMIGIGHAEILDLIAEKTKRDVFGTVSLPKCP